MKIHVLGPGCAKCHKTFDNAQEAVKAAGVQAEVVKVEKIDEIMKFGVMITPALAIDGQVKVAGKVPSVEDIKKWVTGK